MRYVSYDLWLKVQSFIFIVVFSCFSCLAAYAAIPDYVVLKSTSLAGGARWDYLTYDGLSHLLYITRGDHVDIMDTSTMTLFNSIPTEAGVHGVALAHDIGKGFISNGKTGSVIVFDLSSFKSIDTVPAAEDADAIVYDQQTHRVFTANGDSASLSVIDATNDKNIESIPLNGKPEFAVLDNKGKLFVNIVDKNQMVVVDTKTLKIFARYALAPACTSPTGLSIDIKRERLFVGCRGQTLAIIDGNTGKSLASLPIGRSNDATRYDASRNLIFCSNGDGTLTVIGSDGPNSYKVEQIVKTMTGARTMALDPESHTIYLVSAKIDHIDSPTPKHPFPRPHFKDGTFTLITVANQPLMVTP